MVCPSAKINIEWNPASSGCASRHACMAWGCCTRCSPSRRIEAVSGGAGHVSRGGGAARGRAGGAGHGLWPPAARQLLRNAERVRVSDRAGVSVGGVALSLRQHRRGVVSAGLPDDAGRRRWSSRSATWPNVRRARRLADRAHRAGAGGIRGAAADRGRVGVLSDAGAAPEEPSAAARCSRSCRRSRRSTT